MSLTREQVLLEYAKCVNDTPYALKTYLYFPYDNWSSGWRREKGMRTEGGYGFQTSILKHRHLLIQTSLLDTRPDYRS